jgi:HAMP domain-containing protein
MKKKIRNKFKKKLKYKILSIFIMLSIILIGNSLWAVYNFNTLNQSIENIMVSNYRSIEAAQNMLVAIERQDSAELSYMFVKDENINSLFRENEKEFIKHLTVVENNITEPGEEKIIGEINALYTEYLEKYYALQKMDLLTESDEIQNYYYDEILPVFEETKLKTRELLAINQESMVSRKENAQEVALRATYSTIFIAIVTIMLGLIVAYYLIKQIIKPIYLLIEKVKKIASGNYEQKIDIKRDDEISQLANEFNIMTTKLKSYRELNVKKLKEEKQKIEAIIDGIEDGIIVTNRDNKVIRINVITEEIFHIKHEKIMNKHFLEVFNNNKFLIKLQKHKIQMKILILMILLILK